MTNILIIDSSPVAEGSVSRLLTQEFEASVRSHLPQVTIVRRDVGLNPPPHLDGMAIGAFFTPPDQSSEQLAQAARFSNELVDEFLAADLVVIGSPMHNFSVTSGLKAYIDHIVRLGLTFSYSENGPIGLAKDRSVLVLTARGGLYGEGTPGHGLDHQATYLRTILGFIGISDVEFVHCEGVAVNDEVRAQSLAAAMEQIGRHSSRMAV